MKISLRKLSLALLITTSLIYLSGCAATGSQFTGLEKAASPDVGVVYFYRPKAFSGGGVKVKVLDNGAEILRLQNGQFIRYEVAPGKHEFRTDTMAIDKAIDLTIEAGKTYFVRTGIRMGAWTSTWFLTRVYEDEAVDELATCCKSGS